MYYSFVARKNQIVIVSRSISWIVLILVCFFSGVIAQTENPSQTIDLDISKWIADSLLKSNQANFRLISDYSYKMRRIVTEQNGKTSSMLFESYFPSRLKNKGGTGGVIITLEENGVALSGKKIEKQRREAAAKLTKIANASADKSTLLEEQREKGISLDWTYNIAVSLSSFLQTCEFDKPFRETIDGRETISLNFDSCAASKLSADKSYLPNIQGKVWFDALEKAPIRLDAWQKNENSASPKTRILFKQQRIAESLWFPSLIRVEGIGSEAVFPNLKINWQLEFFDYKLPQTEVKDVKLNSKPHSEN